MEKVFFVSLGCDKNLVDSEHMLGALSDAGYIITDDEALADVIVINTCCFIADAKDESVETILELAEYRKSGSCSIFVIAGCMAERYGAEITETLEEVDAVMGTADYPHLVSIIEEVKSGKRVVRTGGKDRPADCKDRIRQALKSGNENDPVPKGNDKDKEACESAVALKPANEDKRALESCRQRGSGEKRLVTTGGHYEFLKIAEGCDKKCTYCIIPRLRGRYRSVPIEELLCEAKTLADGGVKELVLVAQETSLYGVDIYGKKMLHVLLSKLCRIEGLCWIRVMYCYPEEIYEELIDVMAKEEKICPYLDIPVQHASDKILKRMGRKTTGRQLRNEIKRIRERLPDITLRTTLIAGFPGETKGDFEELKAFVSETCFEHLGVFTYSREEDTPAYEMEGQLEENEKERRKEELMLSQQEVVFERNEALIGTTAEVFIEGYIPDESVYIGRTRGQAPGGIDGYIYVDSDQTLNSGDIVLCRITGALDYDLTGETEQG